MSFKGAPANEPTDSRLEQLGRRYQHAEEALAGATANYESLREQAHASERQIRQALQRLERARTQLKALQAEIDRLEDEAF
jgi:chromosome segregation ATPase